MKRTLLEMVQSILSDMDSEDVNAISDTLEAQQVASVIEDTYYNIISARDIPEHNKLMELTADSNTSKPTHFKYPTNTKNIQKVQYNIGTVSEKKFREVYFVDAVWFSDHMDQSGLLVETYDGNLDIFVGTKQAPTYYTTFDDENIIMDSYDSDVESTLQSSKTRALGSTYPTFTITDSFEPDLDDTMLPYLLAEAKSACFSLFKAGSDPKVEQQARRLKSYIQNDMHKTKRENKRPHYGRS